MWTSRSSSRAGTVPVKVHSNAIGRAIQGKPIRLMIDTNHAYGRAEALRLGRALAGFDLWWYEEPVAPEDLQGYAEMRQKLPMPIAGGENEHTLYGFRDLLAAGCVDVAQPDIGSCGGITAARHIVALAQACHATGCRRESPGEPGAATPGLAACTPRRQA